MLLISHRGNLTGPDPENENRPSFIQDAIGAGYGVEIDARLIDGSICLGHDHPDHPVDLDWMLARKDSLWVHAKNFAALEFFLDNGLRVFYHQLEKHTVIGNSRVIWSHDLSEASDKSIIPLISMDDILKNEGMKMNFYGVCSDHVRSLKT